MKTAFENRLEPCGFMRGCINGLLDDSLRGLVRLYACYHISRCSRCKAALEAMQALGDRLRRLSLHTPTETPATHESSTDALKHRLDRLDELL